MKNIIQYALVLVIAGGAGFGVQRFLQKDNHQLPPEMPKAAVSDVVGAYRPAFELKDIEGKLRNMDEWNGKVLLVNFWATWCPPCKREMPAFIELHNEYEKKGFEIIGIALDDKDSVQDFVNTLGVNYPVLTAENNGLALSRAYGNHIGALPFSVFIDRAGIIQFVKVGEISKQQVIDVIKPLLKKD